MKPRIHFTAPAGSCRDDLRRFGFRNVAAYLDFVREHLDPAWRLTANPRLFDVVERPSKGGRNDDGARLRDLQGALDDPRTRAIIAARGGSWFSRLVGRLDFSPLARRAPRNPLWVFGFSEITSLVNFVASYPAGRGVYWLCPDYLAWKAGPHSGQKPPIRTPTAREGPAEENIAGRNAFAEFWQLLPQILSSDSAARPDAISTQPQPTPVRSALTSPIRGRVATGRPKSGEVRLLGGCLSVLAATLPGPLARRLRPDGAWLLIEDIHEAPYRIDRYLAALGLLGWFERLAGVLVGDFHSHDENQQPAAVAALRHHLPRRTPIIVTSQVGHVWPMSPVPLNRPLQLLVRGVHAQFSGLAAGWA